MQASTRFALLWVMACTADPATDLPGTSGDSGTPVVDADGDGVLASDDCDDNDAELGAIAADADCDGSLTADDCDDNDAALHDLDVDADGVTSCDGDCDDALATVGPTAPEIPGNGVDENCDSHDTATLVLNEMHFDPAGVSPSSPGQGGDANYDGVRESQGDEFVEIVNTEPFAVDVSGFMMFDQENLDASVGGGRDPNHLVPEGTVLAPGQALVVFGGGTPGFDAREFLADGTTKNPDFELATFGFAGSVVQVATFGELNLNNAADVFYLQDSAGQPVITRDIVTFPNYVDPSDQSYTRSPDLTGKFDLHTNVVAGVLFTPGTRTDGSAF